MIKITDINDKQKVKNTKESENIKKAKNVSLNFAKTIRGVSVDKNALLDLDKFKNAGYNKMYVDRDKILKALENQDIVYLRNLSTYFYGISGIYARFVKYLAGLLTNDWYIYPYMLDEKINSKDVNARMKKILDYTDTLKLKTILSDISLQVVLNGAFYGYLVNNEDNTQGAILELPIDYCRCRYKINNINAIEFNLKYFDSFRDDTTKENVLKTFPKEFRKNYQDYLNGKIAVDPYDRGVWFLCDPKLGMKFSLMGSDVPIFTTVINTILDLERAKTLDLKKTMQELLKILVQEMPIGKDGELFFEMEEVADMHANACNMLSDDASVDILTTFADTKVLDLDSSTVSSSKDSLAKVERGVFNEAGISQMLFATDGNIALEKSILNDESLMFFLLGQYEQKFNDIIYNLFSDRKMSFRLSMPNLSIYNRERFVKLYKEQANAGYSKLLPAIAMGQSQSEFLSLNDYENRILNLGDKMTPLSISSTQSGSSNSDSDKSVGAPPLPDEEKSEKTIQNQESAS